MIWGFRRKVLHQLDTIIQLINQQRREFMAVIDDILTEVQQEATVADSILVIVQSLVAENDPAKRQAILDGLKANRAKLDAAVLAGTPQQP